MIIFGFGTVEGLFDKFAELLDMHMGRVIEILKLDRNIDDSKQKTIPIQEHSSENDIANKIETDNEQIHPEIVERQAEINADFWAQ